MKRLIVLALLLAGCAAPVDSAPTAQPTEVPTVVVLPTETPLPTEAPKAPSAQEVIDKFNEAGLGVSDVRPWEQTEDSPRPNSYLENLRFSIPEVAPDGGQVFVCDTKRNCDALYAYFDALIALAGPHLYQSPSGTVVAQLNSGLTPETASKFENIINALP